MSVEASIRLPVSVRGKRLRLELKNELYSIYG